MWATWQSYNLIRLRHTFTAKWTTNISHSISSDSAKITRWHFVNRIQRVKRTRSDNARLAVSFKTASYYQQTSISTISVGADVFVFLICRSSIQPQVWNKTWHVIGVVQVPAATASMNITLCHQWLHRTSRHRQKPSTQTISAVRIVFFFISNQIESNSWAIIWNFESNSYRPPQKSPVVSTY